jgi:broad specificity phosphatase PhoE
MRIGLIRHFKVKHAHPSKMFVGYDELVKWFDHYELAEIEHQTIDQCEITWDQCYSSSSSRALKTAKHIFSGSIIQRDELKELDFLPLMNKNYKLPLLFWALLIRNKSMSSNPVSEQYAAKLSAFVDEIILAKDKNILIASHGFVMMFLQKELIKRGFTGDKFKTPANGKIYVFVR